MENEARPKSTKVQSTRYSLGIFRQFKSFSKWELIDETCQTPTHYHYVDEYIEQCIYEQTAQHTNDNKGEIFIRRETTHPIKSTN